MAFTKVVGPGIHTQSQLRTHNIHSSGIITASSFVGPLTASSGSSGTFDSLTVTGNVSVGGTLQYEDVTNVDSVGVITARAGINISSGTATFAGDVSIADKIIHTGDTNTAIRFPSADTVTVETGGTERLRIGSIGISTFSEDVRIVKTSGPLLELTTNTGAADATLRLSEGSTGSTNNGGGMFYSGADNKLYITCGTNSTTKRITIQRDDGKVGINETTPEEILDLGEANQQNLKFGQRGYLGQAYSTTATILGHSVKADTTNTVASQMMVTETNSGGGAPAAIRLVSGTIQFHTAGSGTANAVFDSEKVRIKSDGDIRAGDSDNTWAGDRLEVAGTKEGVLGLTNYGSTASEAATINFYRSISGTVGIDTVPTGRIGEIRFRGWSGNAYQMCAKILASADGTWNSSGDNTDTPGNLTFHTTPDGSSTVEERLRIDSSGNVGIGSLVPTGKLDIAPGGNSFIKFGQDADNPKMEMFRSTGGSPSHYGAELQLLTGDFVFSNAPGANLGSHSYTERFRIKSDGRVGINSALGGASSNAILSIHSPASSACRFNLTNTGSSSAESTQIWSQNNDLVFEAGADERLRILESGQATFDRGAPSSADKVIARFQCESSRKLDIVWHDTGSKMGFNTPGNHDYTFKCNDVERLTIDASSAHIQVHGTFQVNNFQIRDAGFSGTWNTGISVNAGNAGACMIFLCCRNWDANDSTHAGVYIVRLGYSGGQNPGVTHISGNNSWTIDRNTTDDTVQINGGSGNQRVCILWTT